MKRALYLLSPLPKDVGGQIWFKDKLVGEKFTERY